MTDSSSVHPYNKIESSINIYCYECRKYCLGHQDGREVKCNKCKSTRTEEVSLLELDGLN